VHRLAIHALFFLLCACEGASSDPGFDATLHIVDAQFVPGPAPGDGTGPEVVALRVPHSQVLAGLRSEQLAGTLAADATAVAIGLEGDRGYYVVTAGAAAIEEPDLPTFSAELRFSTDLPVHAVRLWARAVDARGRHGPASSVSLDPNLPNVDGALVVSLRWDTEADLDLHLVPPVGDAIWARNVNSLKPAPLGSTAADPAAYKSGGVLGLDSNAGCVIDGRRTENVVYTLGPPSGSYVVKVAAASLCAESAAHWTAEVYLHGARIGGARGSVGPFDTRAGALRDDGTFALAFDVP
jgi:hypothetical protein